MGTLFCSGLSCYTPETVFAHSCPKKRFSFECSLFLHFSFLIFYCIFVPAMKKYVDVILQLPLPKSFTYSLPDEYAEDVKIGCRVLVPIGRKKFYTAIVLNVHYCAPTEYEVKDISALLDASPILLNVQF